jgi:RNA polymerase sigma factor (sigma-70 family)
MTAERASAEVHALVRELAPRVLGVIARRFGDFAAAEDAVQEALLAAAQQWPRDGVPANPRGWLIVVAKRRMTDHVRADVARAAREERVAREASALEDAREEGEDDMRDDTLELMLLCCHPALSPSSAVALTLRAVGGLTTAEIARAFLVPEATMAQRISRAKASIEDAGARFSLPDAREREARLELVKRVLYLVFNEGYAASGGDDVVRVDLSDEAVRLTRTLLRIVPDDAELAGLLALMLLTDARRAARTGPRGELVPLDRQDRALWDRARIAEGTALLERAMDGGGPFGPYRVQAAIAALHDEAASADTTDWRQITALYATLLRMQDNPMVALNHAIAVAMVDGPRAGLALVDQIAPRLAHSHRVDAVRAHLFERAGDVPRAIACFRAAAAATTSTAERAYLIGEAVRLERPS